MTTPEIARRFCLGTVQLGLAYGIANETGRPDRPLAFSLLRKAWDAGVRFYDTAPTYGDSEEILGEAQGQGLGPDASLITKLPPDFLCRSEADLRAAVTASLSRLRTPRLWGVMLHRPAPPHTRARLLRAVAALKAEGLLAHFGISSYSPAETLDWMQEPEVDIVQVPINALDRRWLDAGLNEAASHLGVQVFARSVFLQGLLLLDGEGLERRGMAWAAPQVAGVQRFATENGLDLKEFLIRAVSWAFPQAVLVMGAERTDQLLEDLRLIASPRCPLPLLERWWRELPLLPERLVNPSLWGR